MKVTIPATERMTKRQNEAKVKKEHEDYKGLVEHLRANVRQLEARIKYEQNTTGEAKLITLELTDAIKACAPVKMQYKASNKTEGITTQVLHLTDLHEGEVTKKDEIDGFNEFNPYI